MIRERKTAIPRFISGIFHFSIAGFVAFSQINIASAQAGSAKEEVSAFESLSEYPLLADSRNDNRGFDKRQPRQQSQHPRQFYSNDGRKPERKTRKNSDHRDYRKGDYSDKNKVRRTKEKHRRHFTPHHNKHYRYPARAYPRHPHHRDRVVTRPFRHHYPYPRRHTYYNSDVWGWLAFTAITLTVLDNLNDRQQREHELALYNATAVPLGETIIWRDGSASGSVTPIEDGTSSEGRYCREFRHEVTISGNVESLYGTACQNTDGSWEIVQ